MSAAPGVVVVDRRIEREGLSKQLLSSPLLWLLPAVAKQALLGLIITQGAARAASEILKQLNTCSGLRAPGSGVNIMMGMRYLEILQISTSVSSREQLQLRLTAQRPGHILMMVPGISQSTLQGYDRVEYVVLYWLCNRYIIMNSVWGEEIGEAE